MCVYMYFFSVYTAYMQIFCESNPVKNICVCICVYVVVCVCVFI